MLRISSGGGHPPRHERLVVVGGLCQRQALEQPGQVTVWIDTVGLACFNETKEICAGMCAGNRICEQEALACNDKRANGIFTEIMPTPRLCRVVHARGGGYGIS